MHHLLEYLLQKLEFLVRPTPLEQDLVHQTLRRLKQTSAKIVKSEAQALQHDQQISYQRYLEVTGLSFC